MILWIVLIVSVLFYFWFLNFQREWRRKNVPFEKPLPFLGNLRRFLLRQDHFTDNLQRIYNKFSDSRYFVFFSFHTPSVVIRDPELLKLIMVKDFDAFSEHLPLSREDIDPVWSKNLLTLQEERWRRVRATLSPAYTSSKMRLMFKLMNESAKNFSRHYSQMDGTIKLDMIESLRRYANDIIATTAFGITCDSLEDKDNEFFVMGNETANFEGFRALKFIAYQASPFLAKLFNIKIFDDKVVAFFGKIITDNIKLREEEDIIRPDLLHLLMEARKGTSKEDTKDSVPDKGFAITEESEIIKNENRRFELSMDYIIAQSLTFFLAGFDSVARLMSFTAAELASHPDVQEKLYREIDDLYQRYAENPPYEEILGLQYLDMVISESLRKWPPIMSTDRKSVKPYTLPPAKEGLEPLHLAKGAVIWIPIYLIHRDPQNYPNPDSFDPERFSDENKSNIKPFTFLPFGAGPRNCIGSRFALLEAKILFYHLLANFEILPTEESKLPMKLKKGSLQMTVDGGIKLGIKKRVG